MADQRDQGRIYRAGGCILLLLAWALLLFRLNEAPPGFQHDQTFSALDAMQVLGGHYPIYFPDNFGRGPLFMYTAAGIFRLTGGHYVWSLHFTAVVWGMLGLAVTCTLGRRYLSRGGALFAGALMAGSFWFLLAARLGVESISLLPLAVGMVYFLDRGWQRQALRDFALAGLCCGVANYTYLASRTLLLLVPLLIGYVLFAALWTWRVKTTAGRILVDGHGSQQGGLTNRAPGRGAGWQPPAWRQSALPGLLLALAVTVAVSSPLLWYLSRQPGTADGRIGQLSGALTAALQGAWEPLLANTWDTIRSILWHGSTALPYHYGVPGRPALQPVWAVCLLAGLVLTVARGYRAHEFLLLAALFLGLSPDLLSGADALYMRAIYALPLLAILGARGLWAGGAALRRGLDRRQPDHLAGPRGRALRLAVAGLALAGLLAWHVADSSRAYFVAWAQAEPTQRIYNADFRAAVPMADAQPADEQVFMSTDRLLDLDQATYRFYEPQRAAIQWNLLPAAPPLPAHGSALYLFPASAKVPGALAALSDVMADRFSLPASYGSYQLLQGFRLSAADIATQLQAWGVRPLDPPPIFGDTLRLDAAGFRDQGASGDLITAWTVLAPWPWPARPGYPPAVPKFSAAVTDAADYKWTQADVESSLPFQTWQSGQRLLQITRVPLPADLPPGRYQVRLALYDDERGSLAVRYGERALGAAPAVAAADLGLRPAAPAPRPPYTVTAGLEPAAPLPTLRALGKWEPLLTLSAGRPAAVHLSWQALQPFETAGLRFTVRARAADGSIAWEQAADPPEALPAVWPGGRVLRLTHRLEPEVPAPGLAQARLEICAERAAIALACGEIGRPTITYQPPLLTLARPPYYPSGADWAGQISLAGYDLAQSSQAISLTLYWQTGSVSRAALKRFVHVAAADQAMLAQADADLANAGVPAALWQPGEYAIEHLLLPIPAGQAAAALYVGLYDPASGERLPVRLPSGSAPADRRLALPLSAPPVSGSP